MKQQRMVNLGLVVILAGCLSACSGSRPQHLGSTNTTLLPCPDSPNCVSSLADPDDTTHHIAALNKSTKLDAKQLIIDWIANNENAQLIVDSEHYLYAEFTSALMGFVDDLELLFTPDGKTIHVRSASRLGYSDLGENRKRVEALRTAIEKH